MRTLDEKMYGSCHRDVPARFRASLVQCSEHPYVTRTFLFLVLVGVFLFNGVVYGEEGVPAEVREVLAQPEIVETKVVELSKEEIASIENSLGDRLEAHSYSLYIGRNGDNITGYCIGVTSKGLHGPIVFLVAISPAGKITNMSVYSSREIRGEAIKQKRFLKQFFKKTVKNQLRIGKDIQAVTGATISSAAAATSAKKALLIVNTFKQRS